MYIDLPIGVALELPRSFCCSNYSRFNFLNIQFLRFFSQFITPSYHELIFFQYNFKQLNSLVFFFVVIFLQIHLLSCFIFIFCVILQMTTFHFGENLISPFQWGDSKVVQVIEKCLLQCLGLWLIPYMPLWMLFSMIVRK